jgi:hypothetical protein
MPDKSRHVRGKHLSRRKKRKMGHGTLPTVAQRQAITQPEVPTSPAKKVPAPTVTPTATRYPYVAAELRRIGILAGIMSVALVVLVLVLS